MNAPERLNAIRAKLRKSNHAFSPKPAGLNRAKNGQPARIRFYSPPLEKPQGSYDVFGTNFSEARKAEWLQRADKTPAKPIRPKRIKKRHYLTAIAEKWKTLKRC